MGMGSHLKALGGLMPNVYRIVSDEGEVRGGWTAASPGLPPTPEAVGARLKEDGVSFPDGRADQTSASARRSGMRSEMMLRPWRISGLVRATTRPGLPR
jgi:hypothetical protein